MRLSSTIWSVLMAGLLFACSEQTPEATNADVAASETPVTAETKADDNAQTSSAYVDKISAIKSRADIQVAFSSLENQRQQLIAEMIELTEIPAPPFGEEVRAAHFAEMLKATGLEDVRMDELGNVIAIRKGISPSARNIAVVAHLDTVFPPEIIIKVRKDGDTYYAPGIGDNSRALVALLSLARAMDAANITTDDNIWLVGSLGEEGLGDLRGVKHLFREGAEKIDLFIAVDGGSNNRLVVTAVGSHRYKVSVKGPGGHSWGDFGAANPHHALARATNLFVQRAATLSNDGGEKVSFNIGRIGGGTSINSIPFESWMEVDMRSATQSRLDAMDAIFQQAMVDGVAAENAATTVGEDITLQIEQVGKRPGGSTDKNTSLVQNAVAAMAEFGLDAQLVSSSTDANVPMSIGIPAITVARGGVSGDAHSPDEWWRDEDSHIATEILLLILAAEAGIK